MAWQVNNDHSVPYRSMGQKDIQASTTITATTTTSALFVGKGLFNVEVDVTALSLGTGFDVVAFYVERNTIASTTDWKQCGLVMVGDVTGTGLSDQGVDNYNFPINNTGDNQIRINALVLGSATSVTYSAKVSPLRDKSVA
jgi:hypothetical protein